MKYLSIPLIALLGLLVCTAGCGTMPSLADNSDYASLEYIKEVKGQSSSAIYDGVKLWIAENFKSAKHVIDFEDREHGVLIGNGVLPNIMLDSGLIQMPEQASFKMKVEVKDGKMRLTFTQFEIVGRPNSTLYKSEATQIRSRLTGFGDDIVKYLESKKSADF